MSLEIVANAPLVTHPIHMEFDHHGRLWVVEWISDDARGSSKRPENQEFSARIATLSDTDNDGRMDARIVYADRLRLPASIVVQGSGVYVSQPDSLIWLQDLDGDGRSDQRTTVTSVGTDRTLGSDNAPPRERRLDPPIFANLDNWIYWPSHGLRIRAIPGHPGHWNHERIPTGPHSISGHDEVGRLIHVSTEGRFQFESLPYRFLHRNPNHAPQTPGAKVSTETQGQSIRGDLRGAMPIESQPPQAASRPKASADTRAAPPTGAMIYRGDLLPPQYRNTLFACDPEHGMIHQYRVTSDTDSTATQAAVEPIVFLSLETGDFTPVQLQNGPDGALYIADIGDGFTTKPQKPTRPKESADRSPRSGRSKATGRILRITPPSKASRQKAQLADMPSLWETTSRFTSDNGFWSDAAQRWLVDTSPSKSARILEQWVSDHQRLVGNKDSTPAAIRLRALWTLEGQGRLTSEILQIAMEDPDPTVRSAALQITADQPPGPLREGALAWVLQRSSAFPGATHPSLLACLGSAKTPQADGLMRSVLLSSPISVLLEDAAISGLAGRELSFLRQLFSDPNCGPALNRHAHWVQRLGECIRTSGNASDLEQAVDLASRLPETDWKVAALLTGLAGPPFSNNKDTMDGGRPPLQPSRPPSGLVTLRGVQNPEIRELIRRLELRNGWTQNP
jgi:putative membrane-bound dehydrogenase-like protein